MPGYQVSVPFCLKAGAAPVNQNLHDKEFQRKLHCACRNTNLRTNVRYPLYFKMLVNQAVDELRTAVALDDFSFVSKPCLLVKLWRHASVTPHHLLMFKDGHDEEVAVLRSIIDEIAFGTGTSRLVVYALIGGRWTALISLPATRTSSV